MEIIKTDCKSNKVKIKSGIYDIQKVTDKQQINHNTWIDIIGSSITYKRGFNEGHRTLHLKGEAYFEVQKLTLPFVVKTYHGEITVLGTSFNVRSRNDEFEVGVNSGQVKVSNRDSSVELNKKKNLMGYRNFNKHAVLNIEYEKYP